MAPLWLLYCSCLLCCSWPTLGSLDKGSKLRLLHQVRGNFRCIVHLHYIITDKNFSCKCYRCLLKLKIYVAILTCFAIFTIFSNFLLNWSYFVLFFYSVLQLQNYFHICNVFLKLAIFSYNCHILP